MSTSVHPGRSSVPVRRLLVATSATALALGTVAALPALARSQAAPTRVRQVNLVADRAGRARVTDHALVNAWGLSAGSATPLWVSDNGSDKATLYTGAVAGHGFARVPLVVSIPGGAPTGNVFNPTTGFTLSGAGRHGPARFVFAGEGGDVTAWNLTGDTKHAVRVAHSAGAVYKGIALLTGAHPELLLADFHHNRVDVLGSSFHRVTGSHFASVHVPAGYGPFNVAVIGGRVYVSYALQDKAGHDDVKGAGHGFVNVFDRSGRFVRQLVSRGFLNSPWGMTMAPHGFGSLAGDLLIGNFGDGRIHAVSSRTGHLVQTLRGTGGAPLAIDGLWGLLPANGTAGPKGDVWFSAGPNDEAHGLLGLLHATG